MTHRKPYVGGNWKMNTDGASGAELATAVAVALETEHSVDIAVFPPFPYLAGIGTLLRDRGSTVLLGAQDVSDQPGGAFTGEVSAAMLLDCGVKTVLVGHSERRHVIGEPDALLNAKAKAALAGGLDVVLCIGETLDQREAGETDEINERQARAGLAGIPAADMPRVTIAYEPVWAIGTGKTATPDDAQNAHAQIRRVLADLYTPEVAGAVRIQYGGSVKPANAAELFSCPDIDGGLIGGASLKATDFAAICHAAAAAPAL
ncbi:MAG: triosephosphate isomerase [Phycisphaeraceae bacterium]|nr:MAG: triosephosphate isomerase [Phycisphaeraceae bacterium]